MSSSVALLVCLIGIGGLFLLDRDRSIHCSKALWLPTMWLWIVGSRPVSDLVGLSPTNIDTTMEGSPVDRLVFQVILAAGLVVLGMRRNQTGKLLRDNWPIIIYFAYCLATILISDFPDIAFKRWIKAIGDLVMVLVVLTDKQPIAAVEKIIARTGFILLPLSVLLIKYFGNVGRGYDPNGNPMNTGVTTNKNTLGVITLVISLGALWKVLSLLKDKRLPHRNRHLLAQSVLLAFGITVLYMAHSATSVSCFMLGGTLILVTRMPFFRRHPAAVHGLIVMLLLVSTIAVLLGAQAAFVHALGRDTNLTGRTDIWAAVLPVVPNPWVGAGFESFWIGQRVQEVWSHLSRYMHINEAHNGYIEVYLNLGWIGVLLIATVLISAYRRAAEGFRRDPVIGGLMLAYVAAAAAYSISEAGFRMLNPIWIFLLLAAVGARIRIEAPQKRRQLVAIPELGFPEPEHLAEFPG